MDYFTDVYLKRINKFGDNIQSRVHGKMENDFENKLKKSVNKVDLYKSKNEYEVFSVGILETKKISEQELINYLCTRIEDDYKSGTIFFTKRPFDEEKQAWMIIFKEQYQTIGYNRYQIVLLENLVSWVGDNGLINSTYAHYTGDLEKTIKDQFKISYNIAVGTPSKTLDMICPINKFLKRDTRLNIGGITWRVCNVDAISVPGIMYITLEEDYVQKATYADEEELKNWSITSSQGLELVTTYNSKTEINIYCSYNGAFVDEEVEFFSDKNVVIKKTGFNKFIFDGQPGYYKIVACLKEAPMVKQEFELNITEQEQNWLAIVGPKQIKVLQTLEFELATNLTNGEIDIKSENNCFVIIDINKETNKVYIQGKNIGQDNILIIYNGITYSVPLEIISPWM